MRGVTRVLVGAVFVVGVLALPSLVQAQEGTEPVTLNVTKVVDGPVPDGTTFDVQIDCDVTVGPAADAEGGPTTQTITFDATGGTQSISVPQFQPTCTITETVDGGAETVVYAEDVPSDDDFCEYSVGADSIGVSYSRAEQCSVSITNTFAEAPAPPPAVDPADITQGQPAFTG